MLWFEYSSAFRQPKTRKVQQAIKKVDPKNISLLTRSKKIASVGDSCCSIRFYQ